MCLGLKSVTLSKYHSLRIYGNRMILFGRKRGEGVEWRRRMVRIA